MEKILKLELGNDPYFTILSLPASELEIEDELQQIMKSFQYVFVENCDVLPCLEKKYLDIYSTQELNFFAKRLAALSEKEQLVMQAVAPQFIQPDIDDIGLKTLINLTYGLDKVTVIPVSTDEELGEYVIKNNLHHDIAKLSVNSLPLLSRAVLGKWKRERDGGIFIGNQYVQAGEYELPKIYDGKRLPEREQEDPYVFRVCITNPAVERGKKTQWITLPIARVEADKAAKSLGVKKIEDCVCVGFGSEIPQLKELKIEKMTDFSSLNVLAEQYLKLTSDNRMKYKAILCRDNKIGISDALLEMQYLGQYQFDMIVRSKEEYFWIYLCRHLDGNIDKTMLDDLDMEKPGELLQGKTGAVITPYGVISSLGALLYPTASHCKQESMREEKMQMVDLFGQKALFSEKRWMPDELPDQLFRYELREGISTRFYSLEKLVFEDFAGTILTKEPLDLGKYGYIDLNNKPIPIFLGYEQTVKGFLENQNTVEMRDRDTALEVYERIYVPEFLQDECHAGDTPVCFEEFYDNEWQDKDCRSYYEKRLNEINAEEQEEGGITQ